MRRWILCFVWILVGLGCRAQLWEPLGGGASAYVQNFYADSSKGKLYVSGRFRYAGDSLVNGLAEWDGEHFTSIGGGLPDASYCLPGSEYVCSAPGSIYSFHDEIFVTGGFHTPDPIFPFNGVMRWDGNRWQDCRVNNQRLGFDEANGQLFGFGIIQDGTNGPMQAFGRWNGSEFERYGTQITFSSLGFGPYCVEYYKGEYYFGGNFQEPNDIKEVMRWNGSEWLPLRSGILGDAGVSFLQSYKDILFVGGLFYASDGNPADNLMAWDGIEWYNPFPRVQFISPIKGVTVVGNMLYISGIFFVDGDSGPEGPFSIAKYDGNEFCAFGGRNLVLGKVAGLADDIYIYCRIRPLEDPTAQVCLGIR